MRRMRKARRSMLLFPKTMKLLFLGNRIAQPLSCVHDPYSLVLVFGLVGARNRHLGEGVLYRQQGRRFALERLLLGNIARDLDVELLALLNRDEVDFFLA